MVGKGGSDSMKNAMSKTYYKNFPKLYLSEPSDIKKKTNYKFNFKPKNVKEAKQVKEEKNDNEIKETKETKDLKEEKEENKNFEKIINNIKNDVEQYVNNMEIDIKQPQDEEDKEKGNKDENIKHEMGDAYEEQ